ncbi:MAG: hypothetical protein A2Z25_15975 [Planctomycetes bacterium RBG_16_55_9]|nr:MAG: hypothetical protein A2Z25_15975 [Planctomycetes bacterium RBG_16_55_9]
MKTAMLLLFMMTVVFAPGCAFLGGAAVGAAGTGAAYEYTSKKQLDRLEADYKAGKITKEEYLSRRKQIDEGSIIY